MPATVTQVGGVVSRLARGHPQVDRRRCQAGVSIRMIMVASGAIAVVFGTFSLLSNSSVRKVLVAYEITRARCLS